MFHLTWGDVNGLEGKFTCYSIKNQEMDESWIWIPFVYPRSRECNFMVRTTGACRFRTDL